MKSKIDRQVRMEAFDALDKLRKDNLPRKEIIEIINKKFGIPSGNLYDWYSNKHIPYGRKGKLKNIPELFYVIGALLGDGCLYRWRLTNNFVLLMGDKRFADKYARLVTLCTNKKSKAYINRNQNIWFVKSNNFELYSFFKKSREDLSYLTNLLKNSDRKCSILFIEGLFDAEGCVKIIKEKARKTPKICLDITNTNFELLEVFKNLLKISFEIEANYSIQKPFVGKDGSTRKKSYHLRIYKKDDIRKFLKNINTTKLKEEKIPYVNNWLNNGK